MYVLIGIIPGVTDLDLGSGSDPSVVQIPDLIEVDFFLLFLNFFENNEDFSAFSF